jgi:hypothetical protein
MSRSISNVSPTFNSDDFGLTAVGGKNFFRYLKNFNLSGDADLLVLSPNSHFYYDENDLGGVRTLINLKKLNLIDDPDTFFKTLSGILPSNINVIGCFTSDNNFMGNGFVSGFISRFNRIIGSKADNYLTKKEVSSILEKNGFQVVDMTDMHGITYFYSQYIRHPVRIIA